LEVINESHQHNTPSGSESHFRVVVVADHFKGISLLERHRLVNQSLSEYLRDKIHALAIVAKTPEQFETDSNTGKSPRCLG